MQAEQRMKANYQLHKIQFLILIRFSSITIIIDILVRAFKPFGYQICAHKYGIFLPPCQFFVGQPLVLEK